MAEERIPMDVAAMMPPPGIGPHEFVGRLDRWCEVCNRPDRNPVHKIPVTVESDPMDETRLAAIRAAEQQATPGPWFDGQRAVMSLGHYVASDDGAITGTCAPVNVQFIAMARTAVPELLDLVDSLQRDNQELRERLRQRRSSDSFEGPSNMRGVCFD